MSPAASATTSIQNDRCQAMPLATCAAQRSDTIYEKRAASQASSSKRYSPPLRRRRKPLSVTFSPTDELQEIPHINDLSDEEVASVWMTRDELSGIRRQCATIVKFMDSAMDTAAKNGVCIRGLEQNTPTYVEMQMGIRGQIYDAVYAIQQFQLTTMVAVPDLIAETCQKLSTESIAQAHAVGINDQLYVESAFGIDLSQSSRDK